MALELNHFRCIGNQKFTVWLLTFNVHSDSSAVQTFVYLLLFSVIADTIRLNGVLHGYVQLFENLWKRLYKWAVGSYEISKTICNICREAPKYPEMKKAKTGNKKISPYHEAKRVCYSMPVYNIM